MKTFTQTLMGKTEEWEKTNPVLLEGMIGVEVKADGNKRIKIGDGKKNWKNPALKALNPDDIEGLRNKIDQVDFIVGKLKQYDIDFGQLSESVLSMVPDELRNVANTLNNLNTSVNTLTSRLNSVSGKMPGEYVNRAWALSDAELAANKLLKLEGQKILVANYPELVAKKWVGAAANNLATTYFNYKCNENGVRNIDGLWFVVEDWWGMFGRVAGVNSILKTDMANPNSPNSTFYDGKGTGEFLGDAGRNALGSIGVGGISVNESMGGLGGLSGVFTEISKGTVFYSRDYSSSNYTNYARFSLADAANYPTANEFRVASLSYNFYMVYAM